MVIQILVTALIVLIVFPSLLSSYKKNNLTPLGTAVWAFFWLAGLIIIWFPNLIGLIGNALGVERSIDGLVYTSIVLLLYLTLRQRIRTNEIEKQITMLSREIALKDINKKKKKDEK
ncbi:MAG: DUF2304 family protein [Candidatus Dojkabacteria bacterium]|jgi:hypothetical protein